MFDEHIVIRGGGDIGTGVALRLWRAGFRVTILEMEHPIAVRRTVAFSEAVYDGTARVEEAYGRRVPVNDVFSAHGEGIIPVVVDPTLESLPVIRPYGLVDAILAKRNTGTSRALANVVIGLGPGFTASVDCHAVVETNRGPDLGRIIWSGSAQPNTGEPGFVGGQGASRVLRAPCDGTFEAVSAIGAIVEEGEIVARVEGIPIRAGFEALLRGLLRDGLSVKAGWKVGDIDPRLDSTLCEKVSDKALAIAGGVLEVVLMRSTGRYS